jgi:hypothetical protein
MIQILDFCDRPSEAASQGTGDEIRRGKFQERNVPSVERHWREWTASEPFLVVSSMGSADVNQSRALKRWPSPDQNTEMAQSQRHSDP